MNNLSKRKRKMEPFAFLEESKLDKTGSLKMLINISNLYKI